MSILPELITGSTGQKLRSSDSQSRDYFKTVHSSNPTDLSPGCFTLENSAKDFIRLVGICEPVWSNPPPTSKEFEMFSLSIEKLIPLSNERGKGKLQMFKSKKKRS